MSRKLPTKTAAPAAAPATAPVRVIETEIIADGDFAGMTYDAVMDHAMTALAEVYGALSLQGAQAVTDMQLAEVLEVTLSCEGHEAAHEAALRFGQTIMPYLQAPAAVVARAYGELRKLKTVDKG